MRRKGFDLPIKTVAVIVLGIMVVVFVYAATTGWFEGIGKSFVSNVEYPGS